MEGDNHENISLGLEMNLLSQEQVVIEFRELVRKDLAMAALKYADFAKQLETATHGDNAQARSLVGGPDSAMRAELFDVMATNYEQASDEVKEKILEVALAPLMGDNSFYVTMAVAKMKNPYVIGDIARRHPLYYPGSSYYEEDLCKGDNLESPSAMQAWLDQFPGNYFAASSLALQRKHAADVGVIIDANRELFEGAAHIVAARHDYTVTRKQREDPLFDKAAALTSYQAPFVDDFVALIQEKDVEARWLPIQER